MEESDNKSRVSMQPTVGSGSIQDNIRSQAETDALLQKEFEAVEAKRKVAENVAPFDGYTAQAQTDEPISKVLERYACTVGRNQVVQGHGATVLINPATLQVRACSESVINFLGKPHTEVLGCHLQEVLGQRTMEVVHQALLSAEPALYNPFTLERVDGVELGEGGVHSAACILHVTERGVIIDFEHLDSEKHTQEGQVACHRIAASVLGKILSIKDLSTVCGIMVQEVFTLVADFNRVMVYMFHEDQHGEVVASATSEGFDSFMGMHWPATDLPQAARKLFVKNFSARLIADVNNPDSPIHMMPEEHDEGPIPLECSQLRSPVGCHKQYVANMGTLSTLVMPVVVKNAPGVGSKEPYLWGLIVCHCAKPSHISYPVRTALTLVGRVFSSAVEQILELKKSANEQRSSTAQATLVDVLISAPSDASLCKLFIPKMRSLLDIVPTHTVFVLRGNEFKCYGRLHLTIDEARSLVNWLHTNKHLEKGVMSTQSLHNLGYPEAQKIAGKACGILAMCDYDANASHAVASQEITFIVWCKQVFEQDIRWAGKKDEDDELQSRGMNPRNSFEVFVEMSRHTSAVWSDEDHRNAQSLRVILLDFQNNQFGSLLKADLVEVIKKRRLQSVAELHKLATDLSLVIENCPMGTVLLDEQLCLEKLNPWMLKRLGYDSLSDIVGQPLDVITDISQDAVDSLRECLESGKDFHNLRLNCINANGDQVSFLCDIIPSRSLEETINGAVVICQEMSIPKSIPMDSEFLLEHMQAPVFGVDSEMRLQLWNNAMHKLTGIAAERVIGYNLLHEVVGTEAPSLLHVAQGNSLLALEVATIEMLANKRTEEELMLSVKVGGQNMDLLLNMSRPEGAIQERDLSVDVIFFATDVSLRRALEMAEAVKLVAEAAIASKTQTISFLCHEIRNPLNGIMCANALMMQEMETLDPLHQELLESTESCGVTLRRLVDDVLDLSKIEQGKLDLLVEPMNLLMELAEAAGQVCNACTEKGLKLLLNTSQVNTASVLGDSMRLQQVLTNIMWNAVKYTSEGHVLISATTKPPDANGVVNVCISVKDTGEGICPDKMQNLFAAFEMSSAKFNKFGSSGLGLHIANTVTKRMSGEILCESEVGKGTTFKLCVPFQRSEVEVPSKQPKTVGEEVFQKRRGTMLSENYGQAKVEPPPEEVPPQKLASASRQSSAEHASIDPDARRATVAFLPPDTFASQEESEPPPQARSRTMSGTPGEMADNSAGFSFPQPDDPLEAQSFVDVPDPETPKVPRPEKYRRKANVGGTLHILLVDDQVLNLKLLSTCMKRLKHTVETATCGEEALKLLLVPSCPFDLVMMDEVMPGQYGSACGEEVRQWEMQHGLPHVPMISVTANSTLEDRTRYASRGMDAVIQKPLSPKTMGDSLMDFCEAYNAGDVMDTKLGQFLCLHDLRPPDSIMTTAAKYTIPDPDAAPAQLRVANTRNAVSFQSAVVGTETNAPAREMPPSDQVPVSCLKSELVAALPTNKLKMATNNSVNSSRRTTYSGGFNPFAGINTTPLRASPLGPPSAGASPPGTPPQRRISSPLISDSTSFQDLQNNTLPNPSNATPPPDLALEQSPARAKLPVPHAQMSSPHAGVQPHQSQVGYPNAHPEPHVPTTDTPSIHQWAQSPVAPLNNRMAENSTPKVNEVALSTGAEAYMGGLTGMLAQHIMVMNQQMASLLATSQSQTSQLIAANHSLMQANLAHSQSLRHTQGPLNSSSPSFANPTNHPDCQ